MAKRQNKGFIRIYRSIEDNPIWKSDERFSRRDAWIDLILMANHEQRAVIINGKEIIVNRGQRFTSIDHLATRWHWDRKTVMRYLNQLEKLGMLTRCGTARGTLLTIVNYDKFQGGGTTEGTTERTTEGTTGGTAEGTQTINYRNNYITKNDKQEKAGTPPEDSFFSSEEY